MKKKFMCMFMAAAMALSMAACGSKGDDANNDANAGGASDGVQTFTVGTSGPLTGDNAIYGVAVKQGVELAVNEINASDSKIKFEFLSQDDEADGEKAVNAYNNMMDNGMQREEFPLRAVYLVNIVEMTAFSGFSIWVICDIDIFRFAR